MLHSVLMTKNPSAANSLAEPFSSYFTYLHFFMCHVTLFSTYCVCIGLISYSHTFILQVILNRAQSCRYKVSFAMAKVNKLSGILQLESISLHFPRRSAQSCRAGETWEQIYWTASETNMLCSVLKYLPTVVQCCAAWVGMSFNIKQTRAGEPWRLR